MHPDGEKISKEEASSTSAKEGDFVAAVRKKVRFDVPVPPGGDKQSRLSRVKPSRTPDSGTWKDRTGSGTTHLAQGPADGGHPLSSPTSLEDDSSSLAKRTRSSFSEDRRPGMAGALLVGDTTETSTSMRRGSPKLHPLVRDILNELARSGEKMGDGHGHCAEVGAISNHLWEIDPGNRMSRTDAQAYFEKAGAATVAHKPSTFRLTPACPSCAYLTKKLCIAAIG